MGDRKMRSIRTNSDAGDVDNNRRLNENDPELSYKEHGYLEIIDSSSEGSFIHDIEKGEIYYSDAWKRRLGICDKLPNEALRASLKNVHPDDIEVIYEAYSRAVAQRAPKVEMEFRVKTIDSGYIWILGHAKIIYNSYAKPIKYYGTHIDITKQKQAELKLMEANGKLAQYNEEKYEKLFNSMDGGVYIIDVIFDGNENPVDLLYVEANPAAKRLIGEDFTGKRLSEINPDYKDFWYKIFGKVAKTGKSVRLERYLRVQDKWYSFYVYKIGGPESRRIGNTFLDITRQKHIEEALRRSEERQTFLLELSDALRKIEDAADIQCAAAKVLGAHLNVDRVYYCEIVTIDGTEYYNMQYDYSSPCAECKTGLHPVLHCGKEGGRNRHIEIVCDIEKEKSIDSAKMEMYVNSNLKSWVRVPLIKGGKYVACFGVHHGKPRKWTSYEVSLIEETAERTWAAVERTRAEEALRKRRRELKAINDVYGKYVLCQTLEQLGAACLEIIEDITGSKMSFVGEIGTTGLFHDIAVGLKSPEYCEMSEITQGKPVADLPVKGLNRSVLSSGKTLLTNAPSAHADSSGTPAGHGIQSYLGVPFMRDGKVIGMISVANREGGYGDNEKEILESLAPTVFKVLFRKRTEEELEKSESNARSLIKQLEEADRNKNEFLGSLSHELRNPLAVVSAGLQLLDMMDDAAKERKVKETMRHQVNQLCCLVDDLLDLTRIAHNKIILKLQEIDLNNLVLLTAEDIMPLFEEKGIKLKTKILKHALFLDADPVRLRQIIGNLLSNALKFTDTGGTVELSLNNEHGSAVICIKDNGIGIKPEIMQNLFKPFTQADTSLDRPKGGLGLGLSIVRGIAVLHGGTVYAESRGLGRGSSFYIKLPAVRMRANMLQQKKSEGRATGRSMSILIIEDNGDFNDVMNSILKLLGHSVITAHDGMEGIRKARKIKPDIIFCDIGLPKMNGYDVAGAIRREPGLENTYLVALSGYARDEDIAEALDSAFDRFLSKPVNVPSIQAVLQEAEEYRRVAQSTAQIK